MTAALTLRHAPAPGTPPLDIQRWCSLDEAAELLGISEGQLRRRCAEQLSKLELAKLHKGPNDHNARWYLKRSHDPRLGYGIGHRFKVPDLNKFPAYQVETAWKRAACVESYREARSRWTGNQQEWIGDLVNSLRVQHPGLKISERSLMRWYTKYNTPSDIVKLIDKRGGNVAAGGDPASWQFFRNLYLDPRQPSKRVCWERTREYSHADNLQWCSYDSCLRQIDKRIPPDIQLQGVNPLLIAMKASRISNRMRNVLPPVNAG